MGEPDKPLTRIDEIRENPAELSEKEWRDRLTPDQFYVCRQRGTEPAYVGRYVKFDKKGTYHCMACDAFLFKSEHKYPSNCGWPAFFAARTGDVKSKCGSSGPECDPGVETVKRREDTSLGMLRTEVSCKVCNSHLGHVFPDGPLPTKERFCINSMAINFRRAPPASGASSRLSSAYTKQRTPSPASSRETTNGRVKSADAPSCSTSTTMASCGPGSCSSAGRTFTCGTSSSASASRTFSCGSVSPSKRFPRPTSVPPRVTPATTATTTSRTSTTSSTSAKEKAAWRRGSVSAGVESKTAQTKKTESAKSDDHNKHTNSSTTIKEWRF